MIYEMFILVRNLKFLIFYVICEYVDIFLSVKFVYVIRYRFCLYIL